MKVLFLQFSNILYKTELSNLYDKIYDLKKHDGYYNNKHYFEIPLWISEISYALGDNVDKELYVCDNILDAVKYIHKFNGDYILCSVLNSTVNEIKLIMELCPTKNFILGGYYKLITNNSMYFNSVNEFCDWSKISYKYGLDYSLFSGEYTIPRLKLSSGCLNKCKFCHFIDKNIVMKSDSEILQQVESFDNLNYKLIYIDDKTFGQAKNHKLLKLINYVCKYKNSDFIGFIIQTTTNMITNKFINTIKESGVKIVELGIESYNEKILKLYNKPSNIKLIDKSIELLYENNINIIPNIMLGFPEDGIYSYVKNLFFIIKNRKKFYSLNIFTYANYDDFDNSVECDLNKNMYSWYQKKLLQVFLKLFLYLNMYIMKVNNGNIS